MANGDEILDDSGNEKLNDSGEILDDAASNTCCCPNNMCFTKFTATWDCDSSTWGGGAWTNAGNFCLDPATTDTTVTSPTACSRQQYVRLSPDTRCTVNGDCTVAATTPPLPSDTPTTCTCNQCGCTHALKKTANVVIAGTGGAACFAAADNSGSVSVSAGCDGTYPIDRISGACSWVKSSGGPTMHRDCFSNNCANAGGGLDSPSTQISVRLQRTAANTWRITVTGASGATLYYDSGNFAWNDQDACDGVNSGAQANILAGHSLATGCTPAWVALGGSASASF